jgi:dihydrolipoamide dehydrogenase
MIVIGGGYIAVELGHFYAATGTEVTFIVRDTMIKAEDRDIQVEFQENFTQRHTVHLHTETQSVAYEDGLFRVTVTHSDGEEALLEAEALLVATGVTPNSDTLGLEHTSIKITEKGFIEVNEYLETAEPDVYAFGDVAGNYLFRHSANFEGEYLFAEHYGDASKSPISYPPMPHAIFSYPQVAGVGVTEDELLLQGKIRGQGYVVGMNRYEHSAMGMAMLPETGLVKLIADQQSRKIIGAHIVGDKASDIIHMLIAYMTMEATVDDLLRTIYIHPALSENIRNAARKLVKELDKR